MSATVRPQTSENWGSGMDLNNRELAFLTWFALGAGLFLWRVRFKALLPFLKLIIKWPVICLIGLVALYVSASVWLLTIPGWWQWSNLKSTLIWAVSFALVAVLNYEKVGSRKNYLRATVLESVGFTAFLSFISSTYTFGFVAELAIFSALIALVVLNVLSDRYAQLRSLKRPTALLLILLSLLSLGNSVYRITTDFRNFATTHTGREFALPILLTLMFIPFLYGLYVYIVYGRVLRSLDYLIKDSGLRRYARRRLAVEFRLDTIGVEKWRRHVSLFEPRGQADINDAFSEIKRVRRRERSPYRVQPTLGWLPNHATSFLSSAGLATNDYHRGGTEWWANSSYLDLGTEVLPNNLAYYIEGDEFTVSKLKLVLNINAPETAAQAYERFSEVVSILIRTAIPGVLREADELNIQCGEGPLQVGGYALELKREDWPNGIKGGHEFAFTIEVAP